jgi:hypothetical protein
MEITLAQELVNEQIRQHRKIVQRNIEEFKRDADRFIFNSVAYYVAREGKFIYYVNTSSKSGTLQMRYTIRSIRKAGFTVKLSVYYVKDYEWTIVVTLP